MLTSAYAQLDASGAPAGRFTYHADHQGSVRFLTDDLGQAVNSYDYDSYGRRTASSEAVPQPFAFTGREWSVAAGLYDYRARAYDPDTGRFLQEDPIWFSAGDLNVYRYVWNDPAGWTDPTGLAAASEEGSLGRIAGGLGALSNVADGINCAFNIISSALNAANTGAVGDLIVNGAECAVDLVPGPSPRKATKTLKTCPAALRGPARFLGGLFSFPEGTLIWTEDGFVPIEEIAVGDRVWSRDERTGENVLNPVTALHRRTAGEMTVLSLLVEDEADDRPLLLASAATNGDAPRKPRAVRLTPEHPVYVAARSGEEPGWVMAGELVAGDLLADIDGGALVKVVANALTETSETVYNFEVENAHSYFADEFGLWVHNGEGGGPFTSEQRALVEIVRDIIRRRKLTNTEADIILDLGASCSLNKRGRLADDRGKAHWKGGNHIHVPGVGHVPVDKL